MGIHFQKALGVHPMAMQLRLTRAELLSANLANVNTPNFQAKDIDFAAEMQRAKRGNGVMAAPDRSSAQMLSTQMSSAQMSSPQMMSSPQIMSSLQIKYRLPYQPSLDGNTVALNVEQAEFSKNALDYQTSLSFLNMKLTGLKQAIEGK
ncbi:flagellar basal body rod protein FlgB [Yersinia pseudotuberculosis]|uniref:Flagellar basal body rod protein FlgB n=1 Tax=Yersinia pseudotuberculosis TaxID=633 RepID=A0ABM7AHZ0_YERPU|nr:flagellar basal body rod protein FlgB [Yersinia pseudotuberculosis]AIN15380.1 flagellar basal-body rod protein FlgB [Yersinia pseudotuberculosis]AJJ08218.1 flagellar basal-body rod protein FlgB [Yersinia pseudotuberculosis]AYW91913.1 flagellar basal body rod protein FlgB [Yersinia pseudotuberculosis]KGA58589.1 flagellar basal-body rod protein FlgB [Yersinia pseudotuberculosis]MBO1562512.1 flagellar basal body rod protein FlgB [Yersinia pseudotuberculosis]